MGFLRCVVPRFQISLDLLVEGRFRVLMDHVASVIHNDAVYSFTRKGSTVEK